MRRATAPVYTITDNGIISIHTLHAEGDSATEPFPSPTCRISIHTLHAEGDDADIKEIIKQVQFQSTPSMRRATMRFLQAYALFRISIHTLHAEGDR